MIGIMIPFTITLYRLHAKFMYVPNLFRHWLLLIHFFCTNGYWFNGHAGVVLDRCYV